MVVKLVGFRLGGAGHTPELLVEAEIVLNGNRGQSLGLSINLDTFLGLDGLVEDRHSSGDRAFCGQYIGQR